MLQCLSHNQLICPGLCLYFSVPCLCLCLASFPGPLPSFSVQKPSLSVQPSCKRQKAGRGLGTRLNGYVIIGVAVSVVQPIHDLPCTYLTLVPSLSLVPASASLCPVSVSLSRVFQELGSLRLCCLCCCTRGCPTLLRKSGLSGVCGCVCVCTHALE